MMSEPAPPSPLDDKYRQRLGEGVDNLGLQLSDQQLSQLLSHLDLLGYWNRKLNLTAITTPSRMLCEHILDSLAIVPYLKQPRILDVGSGGGFPGIPLAICCAESRVVLLDSRGKRVEFLRHVVGRLGLKNVELVKSRVEDYRPTVKFDTLVCRAFAPFQDILQWTRHLHQPGTRLLAMKGRLPDNELALPGTDYKIQIETLVVPQLDAERHLIMIDFD